MLAQHTARFTMSMKSLQQLQLWQRCKRMLSRRLLLVNTGTCCALYTVGDLLQQRIEGCEKIDWKRSGRMATLGFCMGPINHSWYVLLDRIVLGTGVRMVAKKVLADQLVMAPFCCSVFYVGMCVLEGRGTNDIKSELQTKFWPTYKTDWKLWPAAQMINFYFVPSHLRVTYVNVVTLIWTVYLSYMKHKSELLTQSQGHQLTTHPSPQTTPPPPQPSPQPSPLTTPPPSQPLMDNNILIESNNR